tara:strand:+ start:2046 stop:2477 length:432 start_codon:yes stop_codon:yes gene_type:complete
MKTINLFDEEYINVLCPSDNEYLWNIFNHFGYDNDNNPDIKKQTLRALKIMLDLDIIFVAKWFAKPELENCNLEPNEIIKHINEIWFDGAIFPDFYGMVMFNSKDWYKDKLENKGFTPFVNWKNFTKEEIGDLEKWIEENKPK